MKQASGQEWTPDDVFQIICNPIYTGIGPYPQIVDDEQWIQAASRAIKAKGRAYFLRQMLTALRASFASVEQSDA